MRIFSHCICTLSNVAIRSWRKLVWRRKTELCLNQNTKESCEDRVVDYTALYTPILSLITGNAVASFRVDSCYMDMYRTNKTLRHDELTMVVSPCFNRVENVTMIQPFLKLTKNPLVLFGNWTIHRIVDSVYEWVCMGCWSSVDCRRNIGKQLKRLNYGKD